MLPNLSDQSTNLFFHTVDAKQLQQFATVAISCTFRDPMICSRSRFTHDSPWMYC